MGKNFPPFTPLNPIVLLVLRYSRKQHSTVHNINVIAVIIKLVITTAPFYTYFKGLHTKTPTPCEDSTSNEIFILLCWSHQRPSATTLLHLCTLPNATERHSTLYSPSSSARLNRSTSGTILSDYRMTRRELPRSTLTIRSPLTVRSNIDHPPQRMRSPISSRRFSVAPLQSGYRFVSRAQLECELICYKSICAITHHNDLNRGSEAYCLTFITLVTSMYMGK